VKFLDIAPKDSERLEIIDAVTKVVDSGNYLSSNQVIEFEQEFRDYIGSDYCRSVGSGFDALVLAMNALGVKRGDLVVVPAFTAFPVWSAVSAVGALPLPVHPNIYTYNFDIGDLMNKLDKYQGKISAIIAVHLFGYPERIDTILHYAGDVPVIEDCSHAHGSHFDNQHVGTFGDIGIFSFYPTKPLGAFGDAGAIVTDNARYFNSCIKATGRRGIMNSRMDEIQAAILRVKLKYLDQEINRRKKIALKYLFNLPPHADNNQISLPRYDLDGNQRIHSWYEFVIKANQRTELRIELDRAGVPTLIHYMPPWMTADRYRTFGDQYNLFNSTSELLSETVLSLPLTERACDKAIEVIADYVRGNYGKN
jgi:dTDP-4-amino-4,6-dideoxygalactose transaminase